MERPQRRDLAGWVLRLGEVLAERATVPRPAPGGRFLLGMEGMWREDGSEEGTIPAVQYLVTSRRALVADDEEADLAVCVLEAAARLGGVRNLLVEGRTHAHPLVRWTAERLLRTGGPRTAPGEVPPASPEAAPPGEVGP